MQWSNFSFRALTSLILVWAFFVLILSGGVLFVSPPGRIANWSDWRLLGLAKLQWQGAHTLTAIVFLTGGLLHLLKFNLKVFLAYAWGRAQRGWRYRRELAASFILMFVVLAGTIIELPPFESVMAAGEIVKNSWANPTNQPPIPHMEEMTIRETTGKLELPADKVVRILREQGAASAQPEISLKQAAREMNKSPQELYRDLLHNSPLPPENQPQAGFGYGIGLGRKTVAQVAADLRVAPETLIAALASHNIKAAQDDLLREVASANGKTPADLFQILQQTTNQEAPQK